MTETEMKLEELRRLRNSTSAGDRPRLLRMRRKSVIADGDETSETDVEASPPGLLNSLLRWVKAKPADVEESDEARKAVDESIARKVPLMRPGVKLLERNRRLQRQLDDVFKE